MISVNCESLKNEIDTLNSFISSYEITLLNLFNQLKDSCVNWQDGNSIKFDNTIYQEKVESDLVLQSVKNKKEIYEYIYNRYIMLGKNIKCNLDNKDAILNQIESCKNHATSIIYLFDQMDLSTPFPERNKIINQKNKVVTIRNELIDIRNSTSYLYRKIADFEKEIQAKINQLETIKINDFSFDIVV